MSTPPRAAFYVDENLHGSFADVLASADIDVVRCKELNLQGVPDAVWIPRVSEMGLIIVTGDVKMRYRSVEKAALIASRARVLFITMGKAKHIELAQNFVRSKRNIERFVSRHEAPWIATLARPSRPDLPGHLRRIDLG